MPVERVDVGGGVGIVYRDEQVIDLSDYAQAIREIILPLGCAIELEPGRSIVGNAGLLVSKVINVKRGVSRDSCPVFTEPILQAWKIPYRILSKETGLAELTAAYRDCQTESRASAVLIPE